MTPPQFPNFFDMIQHAIRHFRTGFLPGLRMALPLLVIFSILFAVLRVTVLRDAFLDSAAAGMNDRLDLGSLLVQTLVVVLSFLASIVFLGFVFTASYASAIGATSRKDGFKLGTGDQPLFKLTHEQQVVIQSGLVNLLKLWPVIPFGIASAVAYQISFMIDVTTLRGFGADAPFEAVLAHNVARLVALFFGLWFAARLIRFYLFRPAVVVETGIADEAAIDSVLMSRFPKCLLDKTFLYLLGIVLIAFGVPILVKYLWAGITDVVPILSRGLFGLTLQYGIGYLGWVFSAVLLAGCVSFIRGRAIGGATEGPTEVRTADGSNGQEEL